MIFLKVSLLFTDNLDRESQRVMVARSSHAARVTTPITARDAASCQPNRSMPFVPSELCDLTFSSKLNRRTSTPGFRFGQQLLGC